MKKWTQQTIAIFILPQGILQPQSNCIFSSVSVYQFTMGSPNNIAMVYASFPINGSGKPLHSVWIELINSKYTGQRATRVLFSYYDP